MNNRNKYIIKIQTYNRKDIGKENLISDTIKSLRKSGLWESNIDFHLVIHDSGSVDKSFLDEFKCLEKTTIVLPNEKYNATENFYHSFEYIMNNFESDYVIHIEDDVIFCKNWIENIDSWLKKHSDKTDLMFSFFTPYLHIKTLFNSKCDIWKDYKVDGFYGTQCICVKYEQLSNILNTLEKRISVKKAYDGAYDIYLHDWLLNFGTRPVIKASCPCLVQHRNLHSTLTHNAEVLSFTFLGEDIDAGFHNA